MYARPDLMAGKKILYVHGFASSGQNGMVKTMRLLLPEATVIAPDLPVEPQEAMILLKDLCAREKPDLIVGASLGGLYTEQLHGYDRILVNPTFSPADTILKNNGLGRQEYHSPREDGQTSFLVNKALLEHYREVTAEAFKEIEADRVYGLFGKDDPIIHCFDDFAAHYPQAIYFDGEHYLNDHAFLHGVFPVIQWIDDKQEGRQRRSILVDIDTVNDSNNSHRCIAKLNEWYDIYFLASVNPNNPEDYADAVRRASSELGVRSWNRVLPGNHYEMMLGDYLVSRRESDFMGTFVEFGSEQFKTWDDVLTFFERLGGQ